MRWVFLLSVLIVACGCSSDPLTCLDISLDEDEVCVGADDFSRNEIEDDVGEVIGNAEECWYYCARDPKTGECGGYVSSTFHPLSDEDDVIIGVPMDRPDEDDNTADCYDPKYDVTVKVKVPNESGGSGETGKVIINT